MQFVRQRTLTAWELSLLPLCGAFPLAGWIFWGTVDAQGAAMSAAQVIVLLVVVWHLWLLDTPPDRVPARLMMFGCSALFVLYGSETRLLQA